MQFESLFKPIKIGNMIVKNRFVVPAMGTNLAEAGGYVSQRMIDYYAERARGGFGLITIEVTDIDPTAHVIASEPGLWKDDQIDGYRRLVEACHRYGAKVSAQLHHCGRSTIPERILGQAPMGVDSVPCPTYQAIPQKMTRDEILRLARLWGEAAARAKAAGVDAIEIHGAHAYLIAQFTSEISNHRTDEFGGCFENRMRFAKLVIQNVQEKAGKDMPLIYRVSGEEAVPGGNTKFDSASIAAYVEALGINAINVAYGTLAGAAHMINPPAEVRAGYTLDIAEEIKKYVSVPVISVGRHTEPYIAANAVRAGKTDMVAFGRQSIADPRLPEKAASGRIQELLVCTACEQGCAGSLAKEKPICCMANPFTGREGTAKLEKAIFPKKVLIAGGGPAGLVAAWICAARGHSVLCCEKRDELGGMFRIASHPPAKGSIANLIGSYINLAKNSGAEIVLNKEVTVELIKKHRPDIVLIATGGRPVIPQIQGKKKINFVTAEEILEGKVLAGRKVLILGGGSTGCELADFLGQSGKDITIAEMKTEIAADLEEPTRTYLIRRLRHYGVIFCCQKKIQSAEELSGYDTVVLALGSVPDRTLERELREQLADIDMKIYTIGDANKVSNALAAIQNAADVAINI